MSKESIRLDVGMHKNAMLGFLFQHNYCSISGVSGVMISVLAWVFLGVELNKLGTFAILVVCLIGCLFIIFKPVLLFAQANNLVRREACYQKSMNYTFDETGIVIAQENEKEFLAWDKVKKVSLTKTMLAIYDTKMHAFILPISELGEYKDTIIGMTYRAAAANNVRKMGSFKSYDAVQK